MNQDELKAVSEMVANLTTDLYNQIRVAHDRITALEAWGEQVNGAIAEVVERQAALQSFVVETVTANAYQSEVTEHYRRFVVEEAVRIDVQLKDLQRGLKRKEREKVVASMDPMVPVNVDGDDEAGE